MIFNIGFVHDHDIHTSPLHFISQFKYVPKFLLSFQNVEKEQKENAFLKQMHWYYTCSHNSGVVRLRMTLMALSS